jgi:hypothetical protein
MVWPIPTPKKKRQTNRRVDVDSQSVELVGAADHVNQRGCTTGKMPGKLLMRIMSVTVVPKMICVQPTLPKAMSQESVMTGVRSAKEDGLLAETNGRLWCCPRKLVDMTLEQAGNRSMNPPCLREGDE